MKDIEIYFKIVMGPLLFDILSLMRYNLVKNIILGNVCERFLEKFKNKVTAKILKMPWPREAKCKGKGLRISCLSI